MQRNNAGEYGLVYCVMGTERDTNLTGHTSLALVRRNKEGEMEISRIPVGYYGMPPTAIDLKPNDLFNFVKIRDWITSCLKPLVGIPFDLTGNHGFLKEERWRDFANTKSIWARFILLTKEQFDELNNRRDALIANQKEAIDQHAKDLNLKAKPKFRHYPFEDHSIRIFEQEKRLAEEENRSPRLRPFETVINTNNCKVQILELLEDIIPDEEIVKLTGKVRMFPLCSGGLSKMFFDGQGPLYPHKKSSGEVVYSRHAEDSRLWLTDYSQNEGIIKMVESLKSIEKILQEPTFVHDDKDQLLSHIKKSYAYFEHLTAPKESVFGLFSPDHKALTNHITQTKAFFDILYAAAIGEFETAGIEKDVDADLPFCVVPKLSDIKKKELCDILKPSLVDAVTSRLPTVFTSIIHRVINRKCG